MKQRPSTRCPWWHRRTGWYAAPLVALVSLVLVAGVASTATATTTVKATSTTTANDAANQGVCPVIPGAMPNCFMLTSSRHPRWPLGKVDTSKVDSDVGLTSHPNALHTKWQLWLDSNGKVRFYDLFTNRCMNLRASDKQPSLDDCDVSAAGDQTYDEDFYLRGVDNKPGLYRVVSAKYPALCLTDSNETSLLESGASYSSPFTTCNSTAASQLWSFSGLANADGTTTQGADWLLPLVKDLAIEQCDADKQTCLWTTKPGTAADAADLPVTRTTSCVGPMERNGGTAAQPGTVTLSYASAASDESAGSQGTSQSVSTKFWVKPATVFAWEATPIQLSYGVTNSQFSEYGWARKAEISRGIGIPSVPVGRWGWFSETSYTRNLPGTWTFARGTETQFTATYAGFVVPSYAPGTTDDVSLKIHTSVNPPDADCSDPVENTPAITTHENNTSSVGAIVSGLAGMTFTTGSKRLEVSQVGQERAPSCTDSSSTGGSVTVGIYLPLPKGGGLQAIPGGTATVKLASVNGGSYAYTDLATPLHLEPNTKYYLLSSVNVGGPCSWSGANSVTVDGRLGLTSVAPTSEVVGVNKVMEKPELPGHSFAPLNMKVSA